MTTLVKDVLNIENTKNNESIPCLEKTEISEINDYIMDGTVSIKNRIKVLNLYYLKYGEMETTELINRLSTMYQFSGTKDLQKTLDYISTKSKISLSLKIITSISLASYNDSDTGYKSLNIVCKEIIKESPSTIATPRQIESICTLMLCSKYKLESLSYFSSIINDSDIDCDYRYKTILSLENKKINNFNFFIKESMTRFINKNENMTFYRILAGQYLIQNCKLSKDEFEDTELILMTFAQDPELDYNLRADSADVILRLGNDDSKKAARDIIMMLGSIEGNNKTIFDNAQNVHVNEIEQSVIEGIQFLTEVTNDCNKPKFTFEQVKKQLDDILKNNKNYIKNDKDKIYISLNRIFVDRALYSNYNCSLITILLKIWVYIQTHESKEEMIKRLLEELIDMSGTCSSGYASRLINVISGFGDFNFKISWRDQLIANFSGRLNSKAKNIIKNKNKEDILHDFDFYNLGDKFIEEKFIEEKLNEISDVEEVEEILNSVIFTLKEKEEMLIKFQSLVLEEMCVNTNDFHSRKNFLLFFRKNMLKIREELYEEFKNHIDDTSFDLYFRSAIATYETGGYI